MSLRKETVISIDEEFSGIKERDKIKILCINLTPYSEFTQFIFSCAFVFACYLAYGYFLELVFTDEAVKPISLYITLVQFLFTTLLSYAESFIFIPLKRSVPVKTYAILAALTLGTMAFSNLSLSYLNYPTQLIFKSCKLIPVMIGSILIQGKKYGFLDYLAATIMCIGLTMFTLADSKTSPNFNIIGVIIISLALLCDAVIGNVQEKTMKKYQASNNEIVFYSYIIASGYLFPFTLFTGVAFEGFVQCAQNPMIMYTKVFLLSLSGYLGLQAVLTLLRICGAPVTVTVTTLRKALSIIFSFLLFSKPFDFQYLWSGILVIFAVYLNMYSKRHPNYIPRFVACCCRFIQSAVQNEYHYLQLRTRMYTNENSNVI